MFDDKKTYSVHKRPKGIRKIHQDYGLWILQGGNTETPRDSYYHTGKRYFEYFSISQMYDGGGKLWLAPDYEADVKPGQCIIITPGQVNLYGGAGGKSYIEDNICFAGPIAERLQRCGVIKNGIFELGSVRELLPIQKEAANPAPDSQINANINLQKLLIEIYNKNRRLKTGSDSYRARFDELIKNINSHIYRWWTVEDMAAFCNMNPEHFRRVFKREFSILPKAYLDQLKINKAAALLSGNDKIIDIASQLGYADAYHFSRRFKELTGMSPREYRRSFGA